MTKVSTNAGKHKYLRSDHAYLFDHILTKESGLPLNFKEPVFFQTKVKTEFSDKKGKNLFFKDIVTFNKEEYQVDYDSKEFCWIIKNGKNTHNLMAVAELTLLTKSYNKM